VLVHGVKAAPLRKLIIGTTLLRAFGNTRAAH
jgi:hypothetical protein